MAIHEAAMQAWKAQNGIRQSAPVPSDDLGGNGIAGVFLTLKSGSFFVGNQAIKVSPTRAELAPQQNDQAAAQANGAAYLAARFSATARCLGTR
jgi:hypothetical protein